jgi:hypothetical protein
MNLPQSCAAFVQVVLIVSQQKLIACSSLLLYSLFFFDFGVARMLSLKIEQRPRARVVASKLLPLSEVRSASTWENAWGCVIVPRLTEAEKALCGSVQKVLANSGEFKGYEFESSGVVASLLDMGVVSVLFIANEPSRGEERTAPISDLPMPQPLLNALPTHTNDGHPETVALYDRVRDKLVADGVRGVRNATQEAKTRGDQAAQKNRAHRRLACASLREAE